MFGLGLGRMGLPARRLATIFSPASLFVSGEQGVWLDCSDLSTMFQDSTGTIPVTAVEQPVGLVLDKSKGLVLGNDISQNGDFSSGTGWSLSAGFTISGGKLNISAASGTAQNTGGTLGLAGKYYELSITVDALSGGTLYCAVAGTSTQITAAGTYTFRRLGAVNNYCIIGVSTGTPTAIVDSVSYKLISGNHASQSTTTKRPILRARHNLLTYSEQFDNAAWTKSNVTITQNATTAPDGTTTADKIVETSATGAHILTNSSAFGVANPGIARIRVKAAERTIARLGIVRSGAANMAVCINLTDGAVGTIYDQYGSFAGKSATATSVGNGWWDVSFTYTSGPDCSGVTIGPSTSMDASATSYAGDGASGIYVWGADLRQAGLSSSIPTYQRIAAATDYDTVGFPHYLDFDGTDDSLETASIDFSATDKMSVFAGVRKNNDVAAIVAELSANWNSSAGSFLFESGLDDGVTGFHGFSRGSASAVIGHRGYSSVTGVDTAVIAITHDIAGDLSTIRRNGVAGTDGTGDKGSGNFGNYPLYIGARSGTSVYLTGRIYSLIVLGRMATADEITKTEAWVNGKTGAY